MPTRSVAWGATVLSLAMHATAGVWLAAAPAEARTAAPRPALLIDVAFSGRVGPDAAPVPGGRDPRVEPGPPPEVEPGQRPSRQNLDAYDRGGIGGEPGATEVVLLLPRADEVTLQDSPWNARQGRQAQRIRTAPDRATWEDRRATPNPDDDPFLASGHGTLRERRPDGPRPRRGVPVSDRGTPRGGQDGAPVSATTETERARAGAAPGAPDPSPARGLPGGQGARSSVLGPIAHGRPPVDRGPAATPSEWRGRVRDNRDAELLAADMASSLVDATRRAGAVAGDGSGGLRGPGSPGVGAIPSDRAGGRARALAPGPGLHGGLDTGDPRYVRWSLDLRRRIEQRLAFPRERQLRMDQGTSLYRVRVFRDGTLASRPRLLRSSGFDDLDRAARIAIENALPAPPVPDELAPTLDVVPVTIPVEFWNPLVR